jgi:hypothetical protein
VGVFYKPNCHHNYRSTEYFNANVISHKMTGIEIKIQPYLDINRIDHLKIQRNSVIYKSEYMSKVPEN